MHTRTKSFLAVIVLAFACGFASAETYTDTFTDGVNAGGWTWGFGNSIPSTGGNPGHYLRTQGLDTFAPQPRTIVGATPFTGNLREKNVISIGVDLITFQVDFSAAGRPLTLMLIHNSTAAYFMGPNIPLPGQGWLSYDFVVPSSSTTLPPGWQLLNLNDSGAPAQHTWDQVIQNVQQVKFFYGNPTFFFIFQQWTLGLDNARIVCEDIIPPCPADLAPKGGDQLVNVDDLLFLLAEWGSTDSPADIAPPGPPMGDGLVNVDDLLALLAAWGDCK